jgi:RimJ/RimL family protein N-acetyltransferase
MENFALGCLASERLRLRPLSVGDAADNVRWRNDPEVAHWATAGQLRPVPAHALERWFAEKLPELDPRYTALFGIDLADGRHIGKADYRDVDTVVRSATVGIVIGEKDLWGQGYGAEALGLLADYLFDRLDLRRLQLDTWSGNERAVRCFSRVGFREEGRLREAVRGPGGYFDSVIMGLLHSEWRRDRAGGVGNRE